MINQISIPENSSSNCFDSIIYSLLKYFGFDYEAYNVKYFYTDYYSTSPKDLIYCIRRGKINSDILKDIFNVDLTFTERNKTTNLYDLIREKTAGIIIDPYYCYWSPFYNKAHYSHVILIVDVDYQNKKYICFDVHFDTIGYVEVDIDIIQMHYKEYCIFSFEKVDKVKLESMLDMIDNSLHYFNCNLYEKKLDMVNYFAMNDRKVLFPENLETSIPLVNLCGFQKIRKILL